LFKRIGLFLITNLAILVVLSVTLRLLGVDSILDQGGGLNLNALLVFAAVFGFGGSFISLAMSKWIAKRATGAHVIETPSNAVEQWLVETVRRQAQLAGIGMRELYEAPRSTRCHGYNKNSALSR
jgi:heat shock protein HtpX